MTRFLENSQSAVLHTTTKVVTINSELHDRPSTASTGGYAQPAQDIPREKRRND